MHDSNSLGSEAGRFYLFFPPPLLSIPPCIFALHNLPLHSFTTCMKSYLLLPSHFWFCTFCLRRTNGSFSAYFRSPSSSELAFSLNHFSYVKINPNHFLIPLNRPLFFFFRKNMTQKHESFYSSLAAFSNYHMSSPLHTSLFSFYI